MKRSSSTIWKNARLLSDFPEPMPGFSEPAWVSLLFEPNCHFCVKGTVHTVDFTFRVRVCGKCIQQQFMSHQEVLPYDVIFTSEGETIGDILDCLPTRCSSRKPFQGQDICLRREYEQVKAHYLSLKSDQRKTYREERKTFIEEIEKHVKIGEAWHKRRARSREEELDQLRADRATAITKKLVDLGYEKDLESIKAPDSFQDHRLVKQPRALTEKGWHNIRQDMIQFMEKMRSKRLAREHTALIHSRKAIAASLFRTYILSPSGTPYTTVLPSIVDFYNFGPVKELLDLPDETIVEEHSFAPVIPQIDAFCQAWRERIHNELIQFVGHPDPPSLQTMEQKVAFLKLARNVYSCGSHCGGASWICVAAESKLYYPQVLAHQCSVTELDVHQDDPPDQAISLPPLRRCAWTARHLSLHNKASVVVSALITALDRDPKQTTVDDMDNLEQFYQCNLCERNGFFFVSHTVLYGWRAFVKHFCNEHAFHVDNGVLTLTPDKDFEVMPIESIDPKHMDTYEQMMDHRDLRWRCLRCRDLSSEIETCNFQRLKAHYRYQHVGVDPETLVINRDYYEEFGVPPRVASTEIRTLNSEPDSVAFW
ncbi:uncharacterized protein EV420DRAFT_1527709 [Desarmillaria tabescens]|uniref:Uncharacterized protein n=1 Tax=Armillaria tabescens TaxID=1929756 RepID=A0AA39TPF0_ARMTA|nr:uncharacterized protein EV420DRAFT_1527709 [Desarmillaria tabescens]KAK0461863.1 hypothetical protein EV420DRAFT_1527709 [Desarmillaria tabescens]